MNETEAPAEAVAEYKKVCASKSDLERTELNKEKTAKIYIEYYNKLKEKISPDDFVTSFNRRVFVCLIRGLESGVEPGLSLFSADFTPEEMDSVTRISLIAPNLSNTLRECEDCIKVLKNAASSKVTDAGSLSDEEFLKAFQKQ